MQPKRLWRRRLSALLRLCASDTPVPHTKGLLLPTFCCFSGLGPMPNRFLGRRGSSRSSIQGNSAFKTFVVGKANLAKLFPNSTGWGGTLA